MNYDHLYYRTRRDSAGNMLSPKGKRVVFISYRQRDNTGFLEKISDLILDHADCAVWYDSALTAGRNYNDEIHDAIKSSDAFILLVSPTAFDSDYIWETEVKTAKKYSIPIIPIMVHNPGVQAEIEEKLGSSIECLDYDAPEFERDFRQAIDSYIINADEENRIIILFEKGEHLRPGTLDIEDQYLMAKGYARGIGTEKNTEMADRWLGHISTLDETMFGADVRPYRESAVIEHMKMLRAGINSSKKGRARVEKFLKAAHIALQLGRPEGIRNAANMHLLRSVGIMDGQKAVELYKLAADNGDIASMEQLGQLYALGAADIEPDMEKARSWYELAISRGSIGAAKALGRIYTKGKAAAINHARAAEYYTIAAERGDISAMQTLAKLLLKGGNGLERSADEAVEWYLKAAELGSVSAMVELGKIFRSTASGEKQDIAAAIGWFSRAADSGSATADVELAKMYKDGLYGIAADPAKAAEHFSRAASSGSTAAMRALGDIYRDGMPGVSPDAQKAIEMYTLAMNSKEWLSSAQRSLGELYRKGMSGLAPDGNKAVEWLTAAAEKNDSYAMTSLGKVYQFGVGSVRPDPQKAVEWYTMSINARQEDPYPMTALGRLYRDGMPGLEPDAENAEKWFCRACEAGSGFALLLLGEFYHDGLAGSVKNPAKAAECFIRAAKSERPDKNSLAGLLSAATLQTGHHPEVQLSCGTLLDIYDYICRNSKWLYGKYPEILTGFRTALNDYVSSGESEPAAAALKTFCEDSLEKLYPGRLEQSEAGSEPEFEPTPETEPEIAPENEPEAEPEAIQAKQPVKTGRRSLALPAVIAVILLLAAAAAALQLTGTVDLLELLRKISGMQ